MEQLQKIYILVLIKKMRNFFRGIEALVLFEIYRGKLY